MFGAGADGPAEAEAAWPHPCRPQAGKHHAGKLTLSALGNFPLIGLFAFRYCLPIGLVAFNFKVDHPIGLVTFSVALLLVSRFESWSSHWIGLIDMFVLYLVSRFMSWSSCWFGRF